MSEENNNVVSRRTAIRGAGMALGAAAIGGSGLFFMSQGVAAQVSSNTLSSDNGGIDITGDGGDVTGIELGSNTTFDLSWEGFDSAIDSVTFTLEARRSQVGTGTDESTARNNLSDDTGSTVVELFTDSPTIQNAGRSGSTSYTSSDLTTTFPFAIISDGSPGANVTGTIADANIDAGSLSLDTDGETKLNVIEFTLTADVAAGTQSTTTTQTGTLDVLVGNLATNSGTGGIINGSGTAQ